MPVFKYVYINTYIDKNYFPWMVLSSISGDLE